MADLKKGQSSILWGIVNRRERWGLSWYGWLLALLFTTIAYIFWLLAVYPFLAVTEQVPPTVLVVEGWVHDYVIKVAIDEFNSRSYQRIYTTGGPVQGMGYINDYNTSASVGASRLRAAGISGNLVQMIPSRVTDRDRTFSSALALKTWFDEHNIKVTGFNIVTEGPHARRTRLLFQKAFGDRVRVGIIAVDNPDYNPKRWWRYSEGVREVLGETIAYLYARVLFHAPENSTRSGAAP